MPNYALIPTARVVNGLAGYRGNPNWQIFLYSNDYTPTADSVETDFEFPEDYLTNGQLYALGLALADGDGHAKVVPGIVEFPPPEEGEFTFYGWVAIDSTHNVKAAARFPEPKVLDPDALSIRLKLSPRAWDKSQE